MEVLRQALTIANIPSFLMYAVFTITAREWCNERGTVVFLAALGFVLFLANLGVQIFLISKEAKEGEKKPCGFEGF